MISFTLIPDVLKKASPPPHSPFCQRWDGCDMQVSLSRHEFPPAGGVARGLSRTGPARQSRRSRSDLGSLWQGLLASAPGGRVEPPVCQLPRFACVSVTVMCTAGITHQQTTAGSIIVLRGCKSQLELPGEGIQPGICPRPRAASAALVRSDRGCCCAAAACEGDFF